MATKLMISLSLFITLISFTSKNQAQAIGASSSAVVVTSGDGLEWPMAMSLYGGDGDMDTDTEFDDEEEEELGGQRRSLFWHRAKYYISYGALAANRIPCPPRSGRSYYTNNCFSAHGPAHPYTRGCSRITRCRR